MSNHENFLKPDWDHRVYVLVSNHEPIGHKAENVIEAFTDEDEAEEKSRELMEQEDSLYEDIAVAAVRYHKEEVD